MTTHLVEAAPLTLRERIERERREYLLHDYGAPIARAGVVRMSLHVATWITTGGAFVALLAYYN